MATKNFQKSCGTQAIIIATQDRTSYVAVTYERSVSTAGADAIPRLVQLLCGLTDTGLTGPKPPNLGSSAKSSRSVSSGGALPVNE